MNDLYLNPAMIWLILFAIFLVAELATAGALVSIWFCAGSLAAFVAAKAGTSPFVQFVVFLVISIALLFMTKPFVKKVLKQKSEPTNYDMIIGHIGIVAEEINNISEMGAVKVDGKTWTARSVNQEEIISAGSKVRIVEIKGVKVFVEKV